MAHRLAKKALNLSFELIDIGSIIVCIYDIAMAKTYNKFNVVSLWFLQRKKTPYMVMGAWLPSLKALYTFRIVLQFYKLGDLSYFN